MTSERREELQRQCVKFRNDLIDLLHSVQTGHPGGSPSCTEVLTSLYSGIMNVNPENPEMEGRDHLILPKGHAAPILYPVLVEKGFFPREKLKALRQIDSVSQDHPCMHETPGVELSTGLLGLESSAGLGITMTDRIKGLDSYTYAAMGDREVEKGRIWGAAMSVSKFGADHLTSILDGNGVQLDGTLEEIMPMGDIEAKWRASGQNVVTCDGHDAEDFCQVVGQAKRAKGQPSLVPANTVEGKGASSMEGKNTWHGRAINDNEYTQAKAKLEGTR